MYKSKKILLSLVIVSLLVLAFGSVNSLATQPITVMNVSSTTVDNGTTGTTGATIQINSNNTTTLGASVNNTVSGTVNNSVNNVANSTSYNTTNSTNTTKSKLPYAGSDSSTVLIIIALAVSAVYAYKKVSDYNI